MPFCSQCGNQVGPRDGFCGVCGARQPVDLPPHPDPQDPFAGITPRTASILCYIPAVGWIASVIVLAADRFRQDRVVRFHAFQGLYLFVAWLLDDWVVRPMFLFIPHYPVSRIIELVLLAMSIFMIVKASHDEKFSLPVFGELAERSVAET
ncbi:MAG TPA: hypothetical protein VG675_14065 [Bryobacteraceae bacterium]|nr:hypothetical protein [Bryobacteraceae bacterium]